MPIEQQYIDKNWYLQILQSKYSILLVLLRKNVIIVIN